MSVVGHRRHGKRSFEHDGNSENFHPHDTPNAKARRVLLASRCGPAAFTPTYAVGTTTIAALRSLFPAMNEQTISQVLTDCGSDIDSAIKRLGQLQLRAGQSPAQAAAEQTPAASPATSPPASTLGNGEVPGEAAAAAETATTAEAAVATAPAAAPQQQQQPQLQQPQTSEQWVDALVQTMSQAKDVPDARARAAEALQAFEQTVTSTAQAKAVPDSQQLAALQRDNIILKRAVTIQNSRLQELAGQAAELASLKEVAKQYHERVQSLELSNYSLAQHLRAATDGRSMGDGRRDPHVF